MAVTKIHRTSRITLIIGIIISVIVLALFFFGGQVADHEKIAADMSQPKFTDLVLYWCYILLVVTVVVLIAFAIIDFVRGLKENPKKAMSGFLAILALGVLLVITYIIGDGTLLNIPGYDGTDNVPAMLKLTDMWLYSCYFMMVVTVLALVFSPLMARRK